MNGVSRGRAVRRLRSSPLSFYHFFFFFFGNPPSGLFCIAAVPIFCSVSLRCFATCDPPRTLPPASWFSPPLASNFLAVSPAGHSIAVPTPSRHLFAFFVWVAVKNSSLPPEGGPFPFPHPLFHLVFTSFFTVLGF